MWIANYCSLANRSLKILKAAASQFSPTTLHLRLNLVAITVHTSVKSRKEKNIHEIDQSSKQKLRPKIHFADHMPVDDTSRRGRLKSRQEVFSKTLDVAA